MRAATEGSLPPVMPQGNLVEVLGREVRQASPEELMVESTPSRQRRPPCKTNKEESDEAADAAAVTYLLTYPHKTCHGEATQTPEQATTRDADLQRIQFEFAECAVNSSAARIRCKFGRKFSVLRIRGEFALRIRR